ncbi:MAG: thermonuclease family protein [Pseudomonadota bacterium]
MSGTRTVATGHDRSGPMVFTGRPRVVDGDTVDINGVRLRLEGIDAPEMSQSCRARAHTLNGTQTPTRVNAGVLARRDLIALIGGGLLTCRATDHGKHGRPLATCFAGTVNINATLVERGAAWAFTKYSDRYVAEQAKARAAGRGVWAMRCQTAAAHRAARWRGGVAQAPLSCPIKGNISRRGRIYHVPWGRHYARTRVNTRRGERWFCSETEAIAAGWRKSET